MTQANSSPHWNRSSYATSPRFQSLRGNLDAGMRGDRQRLFEVRDELAELSRTVGQGPWKSIAGVCFSLELLLRSTLRKNSLGPEETAEVVNELLDFVERTLASPAPPVPMGSGSTVARATAAPTQSVDLYGGPLQTPGPQLARGMQASEMRCVNESRLGELLIRMGHLEAGQLDRALVMQKVSKKRLGEALVLMGAVDPGDLNDALMLQREETLRLASGM